MVPIVQNGDPVLRAIAREVLPEEIGTPKLNKILRDMKQALSTQGDGVAIAAPQIGVSLRIFVVAGKIFDNRFKRGLGAPKEEGVPFPDLVFINPTITKLSKTKKWMHEGCLSVRPLWGEVHRSTHASIKAIDETGKPFTRGAGGLLAHIFQHETDHLNGILFIDNARDVAPGQVPEPVETPKKKRVTKTASKD